MTFGHAPAHAVLTAYGLMEFSDMARVHTVDPGLLIRTRRWLLSQQRPDGSWEASAWGMLPDDRVQTLQATAYITWALAESSRKSSLDRRLIRALDFVARESKRHSDPYTMALVASALVAARRPQARPLLRRLVGAAVVKGDQVFWRSRSQGVMFSSGKVLD
ncbi:MAG: hypothetical protein HQ511_11475, partial [Rhodospirillales bacterium]|nr:hypothetical protein [Rhodospirillales bacterium]